MKPGLLVSDSPALPLVLVHIPDLVELPLSTCSCKEFDFDVLGDYVNTCTVHSGTKKVHDWVVDHLVTYFTQHIG